MSEDIFIKTPYRDEALWVVQYIEDRINRNGGWASVIDLMDILSFSPASISYSIPYEYQSKNYGWTCLNGIAVRLTKDPRTYLYELRLPKPIKINNEGENDMTITKPTTELNMINITGGYTSNLSSATTACTSNLSSATTAITVEVPSFHNTIDAIETYNCCCSVKETEKKPKKSEPPKIVLPKVEKVETYNDRVVKVTFSDGTFTKSVCAENDIFDLDVGITICLFKRALGADGHKWYNNLIRKVHKVMDENEEKKRKEKEEAEKKRKKQRKDIMAKAAKKLKNKEEAIDTQSQAVYRALQMYAEKGRELL